MARYPSRFLAAVVSAAMIVTAPGPWVSAVLAQTVGQLGVSGVAVPVVTAPILPQAAGGAFLNKTAAATLTGPTLPLATPIVRLAVAPEALRVSRVAGGGSALAASALAPRLAAGVFEPVRAALPDLRAAQATGASDDSYGQGRRLQDAVEGLAARSGSPVPVPEAPGGWRGAFGSAARLLGLKPAYERTGALPAPVSKKVALLRSLAGKDKSAARAEALRILNDPADRRLELRLTALRMLADEPDAEIFGAFVAIAGDSKDGWYVRREAARQLGKRAAELGSQQEPAIAALKTARKDGNQSLHLMAGWALRALGQDPGAERPFLESASGAPMKIAEIAERHQLPEPKKPLSMGKVAGFLLAGFAALWLWGAVAANSGSHQMPPKAPAAIEQVVPGKAAPAAPAAADSVKKAEEARPADPIERIEQNTKKQADALERIAKVVDKSDKASDPLSRILGVVMQLAFPLFIMFVLFRMMKGGGGAGAMQIGKAKVKTTKSNVKFADVAGIEDAKTEIEEIVDFLHNPAKFRKVGAKMPKGALLVGEPGGGKTLLVKAVAGETGANIYSMSGSEFVEMFVGVGAARARDFFEQARANAPAIIFIDEIDAVGKKRAGGSGMSGGHDEREQTLNQILVEMDGFDNSTGVVVLAATNRPDVLDPALLRPGRFDRQIIVNKPDVLGREAILAIHSAGVPLGPDVDLQHVARRATGLTGAYLANIVNEAALQAARREGTELSVADFDEGSDRATIGASHHMTLSDEQKKWTAYHEAGHAMARLRGKKPQVINKLTIVPKGNKALGFAEMGSEEDVLNYTRSELEQMISVAMGGLVAEELLFDEFSTGPGSDLQQATRIARAMVERYGMGQTTGFAVSAADENNPFAPRPVSEQTAREIDVEVKRLLDSAHAEAQRILTTHRAEFEALARAALERETLQRDEIEAIVPPLR